MTTQSLKLSIHELVNQTDDRDFLNGIFLLLKRFVADGKDFAGSVDAEELEELEDVRLYDEVKSRNEESVSLETYLAGRKARAHA